MTKEAAPVQSLTLLARNEDWLYLGGIKDVFTCEIVGYAMEENDLRVGQSAPVSGCAAEEDARWALSITQTDRGSQYCVEER